MSFGEQTKESRTAEQRKNRIVFWSVTLLLTGFLGFFALKMNGYWDVSSRFDIRRIQANRDQGNVQAVIDDDPLTVWGDGNYWEKFKTGDYLMFSFDKKKELTGIRIIGTYPDEIEILYKKTPNGFLWNWPERKKRGSIFLKGRVHTNCMKIRTAKSSEKKKWVVKEIVFL